jgi:hypothetical protein
MSLIRADLSDAPPGWRTIPFQTTNQYPNDGEVYNRTYRDALKQSFSAALTYNNTTGVPANLERTAAGLVVQRADAGILINTPFTSPVHYLKLRATLQFRNGFALFVNASQTTVISSPAGASDADPAGGSIKGDGEWVIEVRGFGLNISGDDAGAADAGSSLLIRQLEIDTRETEILTF